MEEDKAHPVTFSSGGAQEWVGPMCKASAAMPHPSSTSRAILIPLGKWISHKNLQIFGRRPEKWRVIFRSPETGDTYLIRNVRQQAYKILDQPA